MPSQFSVVFTGKMKPGTERDAFIKAFSQRFKCDEEKAAKVFDAGTTTVMKSAVTRDVAENYRDVLVSMGMDIRLEPVAAELSSPASQPDETTANPYQAPRANLHDVPQDGEMTGPVKVPFSHGWHWITSAYHNHVSGNLLPWLGAIVIYIVIVTLIQLIPLLGMVASSVLGPIFVGGLMLGARAQENGEPFRVGNVFLGFKQSTGQLMLVGVVYLIGMIAIFAIPMMFMGGAFATFSAMQAGDPAAAQTMAQDPLTILLPMLVIMALFIPLVMAYWFAPVLVALEGMSAVTAMKSSFMGCAKNMLPFLLYGIAALILMVLASIPLFLGLLVLIPVLMAVMYTSYKDIYYPGV